MRLIIHADIYKKLRAYTLAVTTEISWIGKVTKPTPFMLILEDIYLLPQVVGNAHTILNKESLGQFYDDMMQKGEDPSDWKAWIHSHADMKAFYSGTDEDTIESFDLEKPDENWFLSIVVNRAGSFIPRIDIFSPYRIKIKDIEWDIIFDTKDIQEMIQKDVEEKVKTESIVDWRKRLKDKIYIPEYIWPKRLTD